MGNGNEQAIPIKGNTDTQWSCEKMFSFISNQRNATEKQRNNISTC